MANPSGKRHRRESAEAFARMRDALQLAEERLLAANTQIAQLTEEVAVVRRDNDRKQAELTRMNSLRQALILESCAMAVERNERNAAAAETDRQFSALATEVRALVHTHAVLRQTNESQMYENAALRTQVSSLQASVARWKSSQEEWEKAYWHERARYGDLEMEVEKLSARLREAERKAAGSTSSATSKPGVLTFDKKTWRDFLTIVHPDAHDKNPARKAIADRCVLLLNGARPG